MPAPSRLPPLPALRDFIHMYRLKAKKVLSQNYLMDMNITRKIARLAGDLEGAHVVEVGPGPGSITRALLERNCNRLDVIEIDHRFIPPLEHLKEASDGRLHIHHADVLKTDVGKIWTDADVPRYAWLDEEPPPLHIVGNLPFNIASPLIIKYLRDMSHRRSAWAHGRVSLTLTFQYEVAERFVAMVGSQRRSRLTIVSQFVAEPKLLFKIPGTCFVPKPEVDVGVVRFVPRIEPLIKSSFEVVEKVSRAAYIYRNKHVVKCFKTLYPEDMANDMAHELLRTCRIDPTTVSIRIGVDEFADICSVYEKQCHKYPGLFPYNHTKKSQTLEMLSKEANALPPRQERLVMYFQFLLVLILPTSTALVCHVYIQSLEGGKLVKADGCSACVAYTRNNQYVAGCLREKNKRLLNVMLNTTCTSDDELSCNDDSCCCKSEACFDTLRKRLGKADISGETCVVQREEGSANMEM
ncbi:Protein T03F1.7 [Aphelenchoides avenae]|nr:Protein T03F1.7 [Aphelenchus avenae]